MSGRNRVELEGVLGTFSGIGRIRTDLSGDPSLDEIVVRTRSHVLGMFANQDVPFMRVRQALLPDFPSKGLELAAALPVELGYFRTTCDPWDPPVAGQRPGRNSDDQSLFFRGQLHPLSITLTDDGNEISGRLSYKLDFYRPETIDGLAAAVEGVLDAIGMDRSKRWSELPAPPYRPPPSSG